MEVILIKDLKRKGSFGDIIEVADGFARNYLIPGGFALAANNANKKRFEEIKDKALAKVTELRGELNSSADQIKGKTFTMTALSRDGKLYGSITPTTIIAEIKKDLPEISVNASDILIEDGNIKYVGSYKCKAQFTKEIASDFTFVIESDESDEQPELLEAILEEDEKVDEEERAAQEAAYEEAAKRLEEAAEGGDAESEGDADSEQEEAVAEQEEAVAEPEEAVAEQEEAVAEPEEAVAEQEEAVAEQEEAVAEQEEATAEQEEETEEQEKA